MLRIYENEIILFVFILLICYKTNKASQLEVYNLFYWNILLMGTIEFVRYLTFYYNNTIMASFLQNQLCIYYIASIILILYAFQQFMQVHFHWKKNVLFLKLLKLNVCIWILRTELQWIQMKWRIFPRCLSVKLIIKVFSSDYCFWHGYNLNNQQQLWKLITVDYSLMIDSMEDL